LYKCIESLYINQIKGDGPYKVCVVDSDSDDFSYYEKVKESFPDVELHFIKNRNYEYGAWKYISNTYPNYDRYLCLQDTIIIDSYIDLNDIDDTTAYTYHNYTGYRSHPAIKEKGVQNLKENGLDCDSFIDTDFVLAQFCTFAVTNKVMKDIFTTLTVPPVDKDGCCFYERNFGIYFIIKDINTIDLSYYVTKIYGNRQ